MQQHLRMLSSCMLQILGGTLTLKALITTAADHKFCDIFSNLKKK